MKKKKRTRIIVIAAALICILCLGMYSCSRPDYYKLQKSEENIVKVELMRLPEYDAPLSDYILLTELEEDQWIEFLEALCAIPTKKISHDPFWGVGHLAARITYADGTVEVIGDINGLYYYGSHRVIKGYHFDETNFRALFELYVDSELLPNIIEGVWEDEYIPRVP